MKNRLFTKTLLWKAILICIVFYGTNQILFSKKENSEFKMDSLPKDMPLPELILKNDPAPGGIFLSPIISGQASATYKSYLMILDTNSDVVSYSKVPYEGFLGYHFKQESNGLLSYMTRDGMLGDINLIDTNYNVLANIKDTVNPYARIRYFAGFLALPNGNYLTAKYDFQYVDMSKQAEGGDPNAIVLQGLVQELDNDLNVIFQWRSLDHLPVPLTQNNFLAPAIEYFHPNSLTIEHDGNFLISARNLCSIIKINRNTGEIVWVLGGKANEFEFIGENELNTPNYFSYQHDIRRLDNGNISVFDNGQQHVPPYSRCVEYELDEENKTCEMVWEYRHNPDYYGEQHGSCQKLDNGNRIIGWGTYSRTGGTALTELHPDNTKAMEIKFPAGVQSQFIYKYQWPPCPTIARVSKTELLEKNTYDFNNANARTGIKIKCTELDAFIYNTFIVEKYHCSPLFPRFEGKPPVVFPYRFSIETEEVNSMTIDVQVNPDDYPLVNFPDKCYIYHRASESELFVPLTTTYEAETNTLIAQASEEGEFIIGYPDLSVIPIAPVLLFPPNYYQPDQNKPFKFEWSPMGYFLSSTIQIAKDEEFQAIVIDTTTNLMNFTFTAFEPETKYFWRVRSSNDAGDGAWSGIREITMRDPYVEMLLPDGGEVWKTGTMKKLIRWESNLPDSASSFYKIDLLKADEVYMSIASVFSLYNGYLWNIPTDIPDGDDYKVRVTNLKNAELVSESDDYFTIEDGSINVEDQDDISSKLWISNFPNPVIDITTFTFSIAESGSVSLDIYDMQGKHISNVFTNKYIAGNYIYTWESDIPKGVYIYQLTLNNITTSGKMVVE